jgi:hexosaminidase
MFHWHVVDSQSFPLVVPGFTELSSAGAYSSRSVYTPDDVKDIVQYAAAVCTVNSYLLRRKLTGIFHISAASMFLLSVHHSPAFPQFNSFSQEIDTPGHTSVISKSHPELVACAEATPWATFANGKAFTCTRSLTPCAEILPRTPRRPTPVRHSRHRDVHNEPHRGRRTALPIQVLQHRR